MPTDQDTLGLKQLGKILSCARHHETLSVAPIYSGRMDSRRTCFMRDSLQLCMCSLFSKTSTWFVCTYCTSGFLDTTGMCWESINQFPGCTYRTDRASAISLRILCPEHRVQLYSSFSEFQCDEHWTSIHNASSHIRTVALLGIPLSPSSVHLRRCFQV